MISHEAQRTARSRIDVDFVQHYKIICFPLYSQVFISISNMRSLLSAQPAAKFISLESQLRETTSLPSIEYSYYKFKNESNTARGFGFSRDHNLITSFFPLVINFVSYRFTKHVQHY